MSPTRNLSGAPSFGISTLDVGGGKQRARSFTDDGSMLSSLASRTYYYSSNDDNPHHRRSMSMMHAPFHSGGGHHHASGEVIGSSSLPPGRSFPTLPIFRPHPTGSIRKPRSKTWDSSMGRLSPKLSNSRSSDFIDSPGSARSASNFNGSLQGGMGGVLSSESGSDESKETDGDHESLDSAHEEKQEYENDLCPSANVDGSITKSQAEESIGDPKSIMRTESAGSSKPGKSVTFAVDQEFVDDGDSGHNLSAKLPEIPQWDTCDNNEEIFRAASHEMLRSNSRAFIHDQRQSPNPTTWAKINPFRNMSWSLIGSCIVRTAPCFWCSKKIGISPTDREIILRLNRLCFLFCVVQLIAGIFLFVVNFIGYYEHVDDGPFIAGILWSLQMFVYCISLVSVLLGLWSLCAQRHLRDVNIVGSVRYMWALLWLLPLEIFFMIGLFDYYNVNEVYAKHWWDNPSMKFSREVFCEPPGTAQNQCMVPIYGGNDYATEQDWCLKNYNATNCTQIRDDAQARYHRFSRVFYTSNGIWACFLLVLMWCTLCVLQAIITVPIVQRSKESNIPLWLTFPIVGCFTAGYFLGFYLDAYKADALEYLEDIYWISVAYLISGGAFTLAALLGVFLKFYTVLNRRQRRFKQGVVVIFICTLLLTIVAVATIFTTSLIYSLNIVDLDLENYSTIACYLDTGDSCTSCSSVDPLQRCPEWSKVDVKSVLQSTLKQSASFAAIFLVYALITLRYGFLLFRYVSRYQIEYV